MVFFIFYVYLYFVYNDSIKLIFKGQITLIPKVLNYSSELFLLSFSEVYLTIKIVSISGILYEVLIYLYIMKLLLQSS